MNNSQNFTQTLQTFYTEQGSLEKFVCQEVIGL